MSPRPVVALLTDFGTRDWFVGAMKGALLERCPECAIVDITHELQPFDVRGGALCLLAATCSFPKGTVFLCVVDPGVGTQRRALCASDGLHVFVGPDNGILTLAQRRAGTAWAAHELRNGDWRNHPVSDTFHGRDVFAPAAARLAQGASISEAGPPAAALESLAVPLPRREGQGTLLSEVIHIDRFGNLLVAVTRPDVAGVGLQDSNGTRSQVDLRVRVANVWVTGGVVQTYGDAAPGELLVYWGSTGFLEIAVNRGDAAALLGVEPGATVELHVSHA